MDIFFDVLKVIAIVSGIGLVVAVLWFINFVLSER